MSTIQAPLTHGRVWLPERRSLPYFIPAWLVFVYIGGTAFWQWPSDYTGIVFALATLWAQLPRILHGMSLRQWFMGAAILPIAVMMSLAQTARFFTFSL